jgi:hypothetical protein
MEHGEAFPPVVVFHDGKDYWLADGFHRRDAAIGAGLLEIEAEVKQGTQRDAILYSVGANADHGLRRTNDDKRRSVIRLLEDEEWGKWSDREIAKRCNVNPHLVAELRPVTVNNPSESRTYTTKHGTQATMNTARIGKPDGALPSLALPSLCGRTRTPAALDNSEEGYQKRLLNGRAEKKRRVAEIGEMRRIVFSKLQSLLNTSIDLDEKEKQIDSIIAWLESKRGRA